MAKIELVDEQVAAIIIKELKRSYKMMLLLPLKREPEREILAALEVLLKYYMIYSEAEAWLKKQKETWLENCEDESC